MYTFRSFMREFLQMHKICCCCRRLKILRIKSFTFAIQHEPFSTGIMAAGGTVDAEQQPLVPEKKSSNEDSNEGDVALLHQYRIPLIILYYGVCSSTLIVINKVAVHNISVSGQLLACFCCS